MNPEIVRQIRAGIVFGKEWAASAKSGNVPNDTLETAVAHWKRSVGKLSRRAFEYTLNRNGIFATGGMYYWQLDK